MTFPKARALLFAELLGSAGLYGRLPGEEVEVLAADCLKRVQSALAAGKGKLLESGGNELLAMFASADEAWLAAAAMMQAIGSAGQSPGLRVGLHLSLVKDATASPADAEIETAARITGRARSRQIFCSSTFSDELSGAGLTITERPELGQIRQSGSTIAICQLSREGRQPPPVPASAPRPIPKPEAQTLRLRYRDSEFLLDKRTQPLSIGRDLDNRLIIEDRKVSRRHARIERRPQGFYLVDTSTNGSFVTMSGQREILIRRDEVKLDGRGRICFGSSSNDPQSNRVDFEPL